MTAEKHGDSNDAIADGDVVAAVSRRAVLRGGAAVAAGGSLLTGVAGRARATPHGGDDRPLDVRTTDVEVLGDDGGGTDDGGSEADGKAKTTGAVDGMDRVDCRRCRVGAQVARAGHDEWYGGLRRVVTARSSFRVAVTLAGLRPGRYRFRFVACPVTHDHLCFGNDVTVVVRSGRKTDETHHGEKHHEKNDKAKHDREKHDREEHDDKEDRGCPCGRDHGGTRHLTLCGRDWKSARDYAFMVSGDDVRKSRRSCAPSAVGHDAVTLDGSDGVRDDIVTGALAGGGDSFLFDGELTDLRCDDGITVYLDGERFDGH